MMIEYNKRRLFIIINISELNELLMKVRSITGIHDIVCHEIKNGELHPLYKIDSGQVESSKWKSSHAQLRIKVKDSLELQSIVDDKKTFYMHDVDCFPDAPKVFSLFGLKTVLVIPIVTNDVTVAFVEAASVNSVVNLSQEQIEECEKLVHEFAITL